jgi:murein L,D-transpeptidase YcbB/YkuD
VSAASDRSALTVDGRSLDRAALERFYALRQFRLAWIEDASGAKRIDAVLNRMERADEEALDPADYHVEWLRALRAGNDRMGFDRALSDALIRYARNLHIGRAEPTSVDQDVSLPQLTFDPVQAVADLIASQDFDARLAALSPPHPDYIRLKSALRRYRAIVAAGGWPAVPDLRDVDLESHDPRLAILRARLAAEGFVAAGAADSDLKAAIIVFQAHHGLEPDGRIGRRTLEALNVSAPDRVDQIIANMERWRWFGPFERLHVVINVPAAQLNVYRDGAVILRSNLVLGKPSTPTPMFRALVTAVTVNPPWDVPASIVRKEILPKLRRDPDYLEEQQMVWLPEGGVRQLPGPENSLGSLKLEMPNPFDSYLHDTPERRLFARSARFFSHGCMRVEQIVPLASIVLTGSPTEATPALQNLVSEGATRQLEVSEEPPVYVLYWTALADEDGSTTFLPDIYGRDARLLAFLHSRTVAREAELPG